MPVLRQIRARFERERPLEGVTVGCCLHVTPETANLVLALRAGGAEVGLCAANPLSTQDEVAEALAEDVAVFAKHGESPEQYYGHIAEVCDMHPQVTMDDGADVVSVLHTERRDQLDEIVGGTEATTSGVIRLRALEAAGGLGFPIVAANEAGTKHLLDNRYGTGQSTLDGILRATNVLLAGKRVVVLGYGWCGRGVAERARGLGAHVIVCEVDPQRALEAALDGYEVLPATKAAARGDVFITATGNRDVLAKQHFKWMKDGAILCNTGHFDVEISKKDLEALSTESRAVRTHVDEHVMKDGRRLLLLGQGRVVNLAAAEGHPPGVMDVAHSIQALCVEHIVKSSGSLEKHVYEVPREIDEQVARHELEAMGVEIDSLTKDQLKYLNSWELGT